MTIRELKARREKLWESLSAHKEQYAKVYNGESEIRAEIKTIQKELYRLEMEPVMHALAKKESEGAIKPNELEKLAVLRAEFNAG